MAVINLAKKVLVSRDNRKLFAIDLDGREFIFTIIAAASVPTSRWRSSFRANRGMCHIKLKYNGPVLDAAPTFIRILVFNRHQAWEKVTYHDFQANAMCVIVEDAFLGDGEDDIYVNVELPKMISL